MKKHRVARKQLAMLAAVAVIAIVAAGCDSRVDVRGPRIHIPTVPIPPVVPTGPTVTESRPISGVSGVSLAASGLVAIQLGPGESLRITAPESVMPLLTSDVVGGRLILDRDSSNYQGQVSDIRYEIELRQLDELRLEGVGEIEARGVDSIRFAATVGGVGDVVVSGRADRQEIRVEGLGAYRATMLDSRVASVNMTSGSAEVCVSDRIEGRVGFGAVLEYWGSPVVDVEGGGVVRRLGAKP